MPRPSLSTFLAYATPLLVINTAYIAVAASPTVFYMANVLLHVVGGAMVWLAAVVWLRRAPAGAARTLGQASVGALTVAGGLAAVLVWRGNLAEMRWALVAHAAAGGIAVLALLPLAWSDGGGLRKPAAIRIRVHLSRDTVLREVVRINASSGTTGMSTVVGYTRNDIKMWANRWRGS